MHFYVCILFSDAHSWTWAPTMVFTPSSPFLRSIKQAMLLVCLQNTHFWFLFGIFRSACLCYCCHVTLCTVCDRFFLIFLSVTCIHLMLFYIMLCFLFVLCLHVSLIICASTNFYWKYYSWWIQVYIFRQSHLTLTCMCVCLFCDGVQPPVGRTSPQRTGWWWPCLLVRPVPGLSQPSWPATCWWPTYCWSTCS